MLACSSWAGVVGAAEGEVPPRRELDLDAV
jgi:hypothetical protein